MTSRNQILAALKPGAGMKEDFNMFLHHFVEKKTLRYEDFAELWKELRMPYLFAGRVDAELREGVVFACSCAIAMFNSSNNIQTKICAIYLLYATYQTQCLYPKAKIRVTSPQFVALSNFVDEMAAEQHYDFVFVFTRLRMERAFLYVATPTIQGRLKKNQADVSKVRDLLPTSIVTTFSDLSLDLIEDLAAVNEEYYRVKCVATNPTETSTSEGVAVPATSPHPSVDLAKPEFIRDITRQLAQFDNWRKTGQLKKKVSRRRTSVSGVTTSESEGDNLSDSDSAPDVQENVGEKRRKIRDRAFGFVASDRRSTRYRKMVSESMKSPDEAVASASTQSPPKATRTQRKHKLTLLEMEDVTNTNTYLQTITAPSRKGKGKHHQKAKVQQVAASAVPVTHGMESGSDG